MSPSSLPPTLPIDACVGPFIAELGAVTNGIVTAAPGAGKTSVVPREILRSEWLKGSSRHNVILVQPRRVAVLQAADRLASAFGETIGQRVGIRMRGDTRVSSATQLTVVTEGVYLRMIQQDPELSGIAVVILDEFHERSLDVDISCALTLSARQMFVPDLKLVVMSATLDADAVTALLESDGPIARLHTDVAQHEVSIEHLSLAELPTPPRRYAVSPAERLAEAAADACCNLVEGGDLDGDVLVFLPGLHEIRVAARHILRHHPDVPVVELHGRASATTIDRALRAQPSTQRRIILSTSLAQTSVTIDGITTVIDTGLIRKPVFDRATGLSRLTTLDISHSTAHQRSGRAGRTQPGRAIRLWTKADHARRSSHDQPAIVDEDLSALVLLLAAWGQSADQLRWCTPPAVADLTLAEDLLRLLGAIDHPGALTTLGQSMSEVPAHPRLAASIAAASPDELGAASALVALLSESDPWPSGAGPTDVIDRIRRVFVDQDPLLPTAVTDRLRQVAAQLRDTQQPLAPTTKRTRVTLKEVELERVAGLLLHAYPDRLAVRLPEHANRYRFATGLELELVDPAPFRGAQFIVACDLDADRRSGKIRVACPVSVDELRRWVTTRDENGRSISWVEEDALDVSESEPQAYRVTTLVVGSSRLEVGRVSRPLTSDDRHTAWLAEIEQTGLRAFEWTDTASELVARLRLANRIDPEQWPAPDVTALVSMLSDSSSARTRSALPLVKRLVDQSPRAWMFDDLFPTSLTLQSGSSRSIRYRDEHGDDVTPTMRVRVQDLFGTLQHPTICEGRVALRLELLSPADRLVAVTDHLNRFWDVGYPGVRAELRGRYPKHSWPDDPRTAEPRRPRPR